MSKTISALCLAVLLAGCSRHTPVVVSVADSPPKTIQLHSPAFDDGQPIPGKYTEDGPDLSPPLAWEGVPEDTKELALICDDPDAPTREPWVHWVLYKIPAPLREVPEGLATDARLESSVKALQGANSWSAGRTVGYRGPAPPPGGIHHYHFQLYALDRELQVEPGLPKADLLAAMHGHVLARGELVGTYQR